MKTNKIFAVALAALTLVGFNACKPGQSEVEVESVTLDQKTLQIEVGATATLVATVAPEGAATVAWSSEDAAVASVDAKGVVTGVAEGQTIITATAGKKSARCIVKVGKAAEDNPFAALLTGKNYYVLNLGETAYEAIKANVKEDLRINGEYVGSEIPEETTCVLEIWGNTFTGGAGGGLNCFGHSGEGNGYISLISQNGDWAGNGCGGLRITHRILDLSAITGDYVLAIVYKTPANNITTTAKFTLYSTNANGPEIAKEVSGNTNGEWKLLEYKMSDFFAAGLDWSTPWSASVKEAMYSIGLLINGTGQGLDVDAILIYEK
ncbi:MAG: Ig-like domain-containing protein [Paludibacteraceae bacterium]|nr:Ig-like domain-containing protein [Paludibacteraceae bacterium]